MAAGAAKDAASRASGGRVAGFYAIIRREIRGWLQGTSNGVDIVQKPLTESADENLWPNACVSAFAGTILSPIGSRIVVGARQRASDNRSRESLYAAGFVIGAFPPVARQVARVAVGKVTFASPLSPGPGRPQIDAL